MKMTEHAIKRAQQRGIRHETLLLVSLFGEEVSSDTDGVKIQMTEKAWRNLAQILDKCRNKVIVANSSMSIMLTTYTLSR